MVCVEIIARKIPIGVSVLDQMEAPRAKGEEEIREARNAQKTKGPPGSRLVRNEKDQKSHPREGLKQNLSFSARLFALFTNRVRILHTHSPQAKLCFLQCSLTLEKKGLLSSSLFEKLVRCLH